MTRCIALWDPEEERGGTTMREDEDTHGENVRVRSFEVDSNFEGWRLDRFLCNRLGRISRDRANKIVKYGDVTVLPARRIKPSMRLRKGEVVVVRQQLPPEVVQDDEVEVLYTDGALVILNKPAGMLVHESATVRLNTVQMYLKRAGEDDAEPVHRLDKDTSGVLVCARRRDLVPVLREAFATTHPEKVYRALVLDPEGRWQPGARDILETPLGLIDSEVLKLRMGGGRLSATTHVQVLGEGAHEWGALKDLRVRIETGRQHQIRVHLAMEGTPIAGDKLYGKTDQFFIDICDRPDDPELLKQLAFPRHALHAWRMTLLHPDTQAPVTFEAPLPQLWDLYARAEG
ncbi:MAG: RluA family pseudouridine synthase [Myxococcota bacterium]